MNNLLRCMPVLFVKEDGTRVSAVIADEAKGKDKKFVLFLFTIPICYVDAAESAVPTPGHFTTLDAAQAADEGIDEATILRSQLTLLGQLSSRYAMLAPTFNEPETKVEVPVVSLPKSKEEAVKSLAEESSALREQAKAVDVAAQKEVIAKASAVNAESKPEEKTENTAQQK